MQSFREHIEANPALNNLVSSLGDIVSRFSTSTFLQLAESEAWASFKALPGAHDVLIPSRSEFTQTFVVGEGKTLFWEFVVQDYDVGMMVKLRSQGDGGGLEEDLLDMKKYECGALNKGSIFAGDFQKIFVFVLSNKYSMMRGKNVLYRVTVVDAEGGKAEVKAEEEKAAEEKAVEEAGEAKEEEKGGGEEEEVGAEAVKE